MLRSEIRVTIQLLLSLSVGVDARALGETSTILFREDGTS